MQMQPDKYRGMGDALKETVTRYGPGGLYKGVGAPLIGNGFYNAVQFAIFAGAKRWFTNDGRDPGLLRVAGAGAFTGVFVALVEGPQDLFKSQVQAMMVPAKAAAGDAAAGAEVKPPKYAGVADCAKKIIRERGLLRGLTQGLTATIARNVIGVSAYFYFYEARGRGWRGCGCGVTDRMHAREWLRWRRASRPASRVRTNSRLDTLAFPFSLCTRS